MWNQIRPPWFEAVLYLVAPILPTITKTVITSIQTGASIYQAMLITLGCFSQLWDCINSVLPRISNLIQDTLPANVIPLNHSALIQILISALYSDLLRQSELIHHKHVKFSPETSLVQSEGELALTIAESLCSIDEDNKHTDQIEEFLEQAKNNLEPSENALFTIENVDQVTEVLVSDILMTSHGKKSLKILHHFIKNNCEWFFQKLGVSETSDVVIPNTVLSLPNSLLHTMFHIGYRSFDQVTLASNQIKFIQTQL